MLLIPQTKVRKLNKDKTIPCELLSLMSALGRLKSPPLLHSDPFILNRQNMDECKPFIPGNGIAITHPTVEDQASAHRLVPNCRYTLGHVEGRDSECSYCLEELLATDLTVTYVGCQNAFHNNCFDEVLAANHLLLAPKTAPSKCPMCNDPIYPWPRLVGPLPPDEEAARQVTNQNAAAEAERRRRAANPQADRAFAEADARRRAANAGTIPAVPRIVAPVAVVNPTEPPRLALRRYPDIALSAGVPSELVAAIMGNFANLYFLEQWRAQLSMANYDALDRLRLYCDAATQRLLGLAAEWRNEEAAGMIADRPRFKLETMETHHQQVHGWLVATGHLQVI